MTDEPTEFPISSDGSIPEPKELSAHESVIKRLTDEITRFTGTNVGARKLANKLNVAFAEAIFEAVSERGMYKFPNGFGALRLKQIKGATRTLPTTGKVVVSPDRKKVIYSEGKTVRALTSA